MADLHYGGAGVAVALSWTLATLKGNAALSTMVGGRIRQFPFAPNQLYPSIGISFQSGKLQGVVDGPVVSNEKLMTVVAVNKGVTDITALVPIQKKCYELLNDMFGGANPNRTEGTVLSCHAMEELFYDDTDNQDIVTLYLGHMYRIRVQ